MLDKMAEGHAVEGMESLAPVLVDDMELLVDLLPAGATGPGLRPRAGAGPRARPGRDQPGVPARVVGRGGRWGTGADRPRCARPTARSATSAPTRSAAGCRWWTVSPFGLDPEARRAGRRARLRTETGEVVSVDADIAEHRRDRQRSTSARHRPTAATPTRRSTTSPAVLADGRCRRAGHRGARPAASGWSRCSPTTTSPPGSSTSST